MAITLKKLLYYIFIVGIPGIFGLVLGILIALGMVLHLLFLQPIWKRTGGNLPIKLIISWNSFPYPPLPLASNKEIRLLKILPSGKGSGLHCELIRGTWDASTYEALSYAWGGKYALRSIRINGRSFLVTKNLYQALYALRKSGTTRTLWVDAICINQANDFERGEQVLQMKNIYDKAERVIVWLGRSPGGIEKAIQYITKYVRKEVSVAEIKGRGTDAWKHPVSQLLRERWWSRVWVLQEVAVAREVTALCDNHTIPWEDLCVFITDQELSKYFISKHYPVHQFISRLYQLRESRSEPKYGLLSLAHEFRYRDATDERDKLFALLGLLFQPENALTIPDYTKDVKDVFKDFAKACIEKYQSLLVIALADSRRYSDCSWCPRWTHASLLRSRINAFESLFWSGGIKCSKEFPHMPEFSAAGNHPSVCKTDFPDTGVISVKGYAHDVIEKISIASFSSYYHSSALEDLLPIWETLALEQGNSDQTSLVKNFNRTICADQWNEEPENWRHWLLSGTKSENSASKDLYRKTVEAACLRRTFFITKGGLFGLGKDIALGDKVCVLLGSDVPLVLRNSDHSHMLGGFICDRNDHSFPYHKVVGQAYVHGIMKYDGDISQDIAQQKIVLEEFFLE